MLETGNLDTPRVSSALAATASPRFGLILAWVLASMLIVAILVLWLVPWQQTAFGTGQLVAYAPLDRQQTIDAPLDGRVVEWFVKEGSRVVPGDPIVRLTDNDPEVLERLRQEQAELQGRLQAVTDRADRLTDRISELRMSRETAVSGARSRTMMGAQRAEAAVQAVAAARSRLETARINLERQEALFQQGLTSKRNVELARLEQVQALTELERARAADHAARAEVRALQAEQGRLGTDLVAAIRDAEATLATAEAEKATIRAEMVRLQGRLARQSAQMVNATREGTVLRLTAAQGNEIVKAGDPLAVIVPEMGVRAVEVYVGGNDAPFLAVGRKARVQVEGWPAIQLLGWPSAAVGTFPARVAVVDAAADVQGRVRVILVPEPADAWPEEQFLRQGLQARAWVMLYQVPLGFELWRQFNGFPPGVGASVGAAGKGQTPNVLDIKTPK